MDWSGVKPKLLVKGWDDPGQCKNKIYYHHSFKTRLGSQPGQDLSYRSERSTRVDWVTI